RTSGRRAGRCERPPVAPASPDFRQGASQALGVAVFGQTAWLRCRAMKHERASLVSLGLALGGVIATFALLIALLPSGAGAASAQCLQSAGTARSDADLGEINKVIVGYRKRGNRIRLVNRAEMRGGNRDITDVVCPNDQRWHRIVLRL